MADANAPPAADANAPPAAAAAAAAPAAVAANALKLDRPEARCDPEVESALKRFDIIHVVELLQMSRRGSIVGRNEVSEAGAGVSMPTPIPGRHSVLLSSVVFCLASPLLLLQASG